MSDRKALARKISARTTPRFVEVKPERRRALEIIENVNRLTDKLHNPYRAMSPMTVSVARG
jgi:hypothetical protein